MYENGVRALQRHDYLGAATQFRSIIERYPEERELRRLQAKIGDMTMRLELAEHLLEKRGFGEDVRRLRK